MIPVLWFARGWCQDTERRGINQIQWSKEQLWTFEAGDKDIKKKTPKTHQTSNMKHWTKQNINSLWRQEDNIKWFFAGYFSFQFGFPLTHTHPRTQSWIWNAHQPLMTFLVFLLLRFLILEYLQLWKRIYFIHIKLCTNGDHLSVEFEKSRKSENFLYSSLFFHFCNWVLI